MNVIGQVKRVLFLFVSYCLILIISTQFDASNSDQSQNSRHALQNPTTNDVEWLRIFAASQPLTPPKLPAFHYAAETEKLIFSLLMELITCDAAVVDLFG